jgi:hypothetical protein
MKPHEYKNIFMSIADRNDVKNKCLFDVPIGGIGISRLGKGEGGCRGQGHKILLLLARLF